MTLPDFLIIGAQKAGSSWINKKLRGHPDVFMPKPLEVKFFNRADCETSEQLNWYAEHFKGASSFKRVGEKTPGYFWTSGSRNDDKTFSNSHNRDIPTSIRRVLGTDVQMILSLRHPVARAISAYGHHLKRNRIKPNTPLRTASARFGILDMGLYDRHLINYFSEFDQKNFLICTLEGDIERAPEKLLQDMSDFIGVPAAGFIDGNYGSVNSGAGTPGAIPDFGDAYRITPRDIEFLLNAYRDSIDNTRILLGRSLSEWDILTQEYEQFAGMSQTQARTVREPARIGCFVSMKPKRAGTVEWEISTSARIDPRNERYRISGSISASHAGTVVIKDSLGRMSLSELNPQDESDGGAFIVEVSLNRPAEIAWLPAGAGHLEWLGEVSATGVIEGKEGWLFLHNDANKSLQQRCGRYQATDEVLQAWGQELSKADRLSAEKGVRWFFLIAPSKEDVLVDKHPVPQFLPQPMDRFIEEHSKDFPVVDLRSSLRAIGETAFTRNDTHWSFVGARVASKRLLAQLGVAPSIYEALDHLPMLHTEIRGDLGQKLTPRRLVEGYLPDEDRMSYEKVFDNDFRVGHGRILRFRNATPLTTLRCLLLGGSSAFWLFPWLASAFSELTYVYTGGVVQDDVVDLLQDMDCMVLQTNGRYIPRVPNLSTNAAVQAKFSALTPEQQSAQLEKMARFMDTEERDLAALCLRNFRVPVSSA